MSKKCGQYANHYFSTYIPEEQKDALLHETTIPNHSFLKTPQLDENIKEFLPKAYGTSFVSIVKRHDVKLWGIDDKILNVMGPLDRLWAKLKKEGKSKMVLNEVLNLTEKAVLPTNQAKVAPKYQRCMDALKALLKEN